MVGKAVLFSLALATSGVLAAQTSVPNPPSPPRDDRGTIGLTGTNAHVTYGLPNMTDSLDPLTRYAITQGGFLLVILIGGWVYRKDFLNQHKTTQDEAAKDRADAADERRTLIALVEKNITALVLSEATNARLARAIEAHRLMPPGSGA